MKLLKCKNGAMLIFEADTETYWVVAEIYGRPVKLFAGAEDATATETFNNYAKEVIQ